MSYEPKGLKFFDRATGRWLILIYEDGPWKGWLAYQHPSGQWVSLRKATDDDRARINQAVSDAHHQEDPEA